VQIDVAKSLVVGRTVESAETGSPVECPSKSIAPPAYAAQRPKNAQFATGRSQPQLEM
jgi:hypothetical protein